MVKMRIEKPLLDTEMTVVRNEFERGENSPQAILEERVVATAYLWHNYGKAVIGSRADIEKVPIDKLAAFYRKYYQPDNAVLVIAGQFDQSKALAYVAETCGAIPRPTRKLDETYTVEPAAGWRAVRRVAARGRKSGHYHRLACAGAFASGFGGFGSAGWRARGRRTRRNGAALQCAGGQQKGAFRADGL